MDNQAFRKDLEERITRLSFERDEALITVGKKLGEIELCESLLNALGEMEGAGQPAPISDEGDLLDATAPQIKRIDDPDE